MDGVDGDSQVDGVDGNSQVEFWQNLKKNASQIMIFLPLENVGREIASCRIISRTTVSITKTGINIQLKQGY